MSIGASSSSLPNLSILALPYLLRLHLLCMQPRLKLSRHVPPNKRPRKQKSAMFSAPVEHTKPGTFFQMILNAFEFQGNAPMFSSYPAFLPQASFQQWKIFTSNRCNVCACSSLVSCYMDVTMSCASGLAFNSSNTRTIAMSPFWTASMIAVFPFCMRKLNVKKMLYMCYFENTM